jgi:hypothetical protein
MCPLFCLNASTQIGLDALQLELRIPLETRVWLVTAQNARDEHRESVDRK